MKRIALPVFPDGVIVYEFPSLGSMGKCEYYVPAGFEAVVMKDGSLSKLYREGDRICLNVKEGLFGIKRKDMKDTHLYLCKKQINKPLKWGVGDIPYYAEPGSPPQMYGANGTLRISVQNMTKLLRHIMGGMLTLDTGKMGQYLEADIAAHIKAKLMESVQRNGLSAAALRPDLLGAAIKAALSSGFDQLGLWLEAFTVDSVEAMAPDFPVTGRE